MTEPKNIHEHAHVQYDDYTGTIAGDERDLDGVEKLLGIDRDIWRLLAIDISISGGSQYLTPYVIPSSTTYADLEDLTAEARPILLTELPSIEKHIRDHIDTNPPRVNDDRIVEPLEFLLFGFKRLQIRLVSRHIPEGALFTTMSGD